MTIGDYTKTFHIAEWEKYNDGDIIFNEGDAGDWVYAVMSGEVEIFRTIRGKKVVIDRLKEGDLIGEVSFIDKNPRTASARAVGEVTLGLFDKNYLTEQYNKLPGNFRELFDFMAKRLRKMTAVATNLASQK